MHINYRAREAAAVTVIDDWDEEEDPEGILPTTIIKAPIVPL